MLRTSMRLAVIDLFCGIGGLSFGFRQEGFDVLAGYDFDPSCRFAYETNIGASFIHQDIERVSGASLKRTFAGSRPSFKVLVGCAPCTPFSMYSERLRDTERHDGRWHLLAEFGRLVRQSLPDVVSMENVPRLTRHHVFPKFVSMLQECGYVVNFAKLSAQDFGVPQKRARLVLIASRWGKVELPEPTHSKPMTVREAIGHLPKLEAGLPSRRDPLHVSRGLSERNIKRLKATTEGGGWNDWDDDLQLACHKRKNGKSFRSVYGRMNWDAPSPVITTQCLGIGNGRFGHPEQLRAISIREAALLQSFPRKFVFLPPGATVNGLMLSRQIGNAVPVKLGRAIARAIKSHLETV